MKKTVIKYKMLLKNKIEYVEILGFENVADNNLLIKKFGEDVFLKYIHFLPYYILKKNDDETEFAISLNLKYGKAEKFLNRKFFNKNDFLLHQRPLIFELTLKEGDILFQSDFNFIISEMKRCGSRLMDICKYFEENTLCEVEI